MSNPIVPQAPVADNAAPIGQPAPPPGPAPVAPPAPQPQGAAAAAPAVAPPARHSRAPRQNMPPLPPQTSTGIPPLLNLVSASAAFHTVPQLTSNQFVPSFINAALIIREINYQMSFSYRFLQGAPAWLPHMTYLYIGVLFIIQVLRAQRESGTIRDDQLWILESFERLHDLRSLAIPGPLIPIFQALASHSGPHEYFGDISPTLPVFTANVDTAYLIPDGYSLIMPNIPYYMDVLNRIATATTDFTDETRSRIPSIFNQLARSNAGTRHHLSCPGGSSQVSFTLSQLNVARHNLGLMNLPPRIDISSETPPTITSLPEFIRFTHDGYHYSWFSPVSAIMARMSQFINGSSSMASVSPTSVAAGSITWTYSRNPTLSRPYLTTNPTVTPPADGYYTTLTITSNSATGSHFDDSIEEIHEQISAVAQINVSLTGLTNPGQYPYPDDEHLRSGPVWSLLTTRRSAAVDFLPGVATNLATHYINDQRARAT